LTIDEFRLSIEKGILRLRHFGTAQCRQAHHVRVCYILIPSGGLRRHAFISTRQAKWTKGRKIAFSSVKMGVFVLARAGVFQYNPRFPENTMV
jgi:hypothetical protein